ncbi:MAG TPA: hypothetical protein VJK04_02735 [Candidatus Paceibacterota bacterium]
MFQYSRSPQDQFKTEDYTIGWSWRLFIFSIIVFVAAALLFIGMSYGYLPALNSQISDVKKKTADINNSISAADKEKLFNFYSQVFHIQNTLQSHLLSGRLFSFLEQSTNKNVFFESLNFSQETALLELTGVALTYGDVVSQLEAFRRRSEVQSVLLANSKNNAALLQAVGSGGPGGGVTFTMKLTLNKNLLKQP